MLNPPRTTDANVQLMFDRHKPWWGGYTGFSKSIDDEIKIRVLKQLDRMSDKFKLIYNFKFLLENFVVYYMKNMITAASSGRALLLLCSESTSCLLVSESTSLASAGGRNKDTQ